MDLPVRHEGIYVFDQFRLDPVSRSLSKDGARILLPARLFDTLLCLVASHDRLVGRDELLETVWPGRTVDGGSAGRAISSLREVLKAQGAAETMIVTAPGRGYRFGARVVFEPLPLPLPTLAPQAPADPGLVYGQPGPGTRNGRMLILAGLAGLCLAAAGLAGWRWSSGRINAVPFSPPPNTVAVLPFANLGGDPKDDTLADGLAEELIDELGSVASLHVAARMSSFSFKGRPVATQDIARLLRVGAVLDGSVRRDGPRVRVTIRLVDAVSGYQIWSHSYDRDRGDILSLEAQIAEAVIGSLKIVLLGDETARLRTGDTANGRAFDAYLAGVTQLSENDHAADRRAIAAFSQAIALDPSYAQAYAMRARALTYITSDGEFADAATTARMYANALGDAEKAVALAPDLGAAHASLAFVLNCTLSDFRRVAAEYARAVALSPGNATVLLGYARLEVQLGHMPEALEAAQHAASLDPLTPSTWRAFARVLAYARRYDEALQALDRAHRLPPALPREDRIALGHVETLQGDAQAAARTCGGGVDVRDQICLAWAYHRLGRVPEAEAALAKVREAGGDNAAFVIASLYADWGRKEEALSWLATAWRLRDPGLMDIKVLPLLAPVRDTTAFRDIEAKLDFPP